MTTLADLKVEIDIVKMLIGGREPEFVAKALQVPVATVLEVADRDGYPIPEQLREALAVLQQRYRASTAERIPHAIPTAAPPVVPKPTPPTAPPATPRPATVSSTSSVGELRLVPVASVIPDPDNPRDAVGDVTDLAASIITAGLLAPIVVRPLADGRWMVVAGHRRLAAVQSLGWGQVEVLVRRDIRPDEVLAAMLIENGQRRDLDPIEEARALRRIQLQMDGAPLEAVARRVGRSLSHVASRINLLSLSPADQDAIRRGELGVTAGSRKARLVSGRVRAGAIGRPPPAHLSVGHRLAARAQARCTRLQHSRGRGVGVGGVACGSCWETVIRADERHQLASDATARGACPLCDAPVPQASAGDVGEEVGP